jgi:hypothetical protein
MTTMTPPPGTVTGGVDTHSDAHVAAGAPGDRTVSGRIPPTRTRCHRVRTSSVASSAVSRRERVGAHVAD